MTFIISHLSCCKRPGVRKLEQLYFSILVVNLPPDPDWQDKRNGEANGEENEEGNG